jgi:tRNA-dihydrouridine synthase B
MLLALAPIDGYTDCAFREIVKKYGNPDLMFTEFVNVQGLIQAPERLIDTLRYTEFQRPIIAQLFGKEPEYFYKAALVVCHLGFDGIDINMGCPAKNIASKGGGAALIKKPKLALKIIGAVKKAVKDYKGDQIDQADQADLNGKYRIDRVDQVNKDYRADLDKLVKEKVKEWKVRVRLDHKITVSVKTRTGYDKDITEEWIKILAKAKPDFITLHARTFKQGYKGSADWGAVERAVKSTKISLIGNGDIKNVKDAQNKVKQAGCFGAMIGRGALGKPWVFKKGFKAGAIEPTFSEFIKKVALEHARLHVGFKSGLRFHSVRGDLNQHPRLKFYEFRKHLMAYFRGFKGAKELRKKVATVNCLEELEEIIGKSFDSSTDSISSPRASSLFRTR